ncbi:MAG TPA: MG2 domain-containing protein, partial [Thermoanaerobaculia bacterium]|nr:MG2 domain-containing protein [Thermoanaerobaculia bacterium]
MSKPSRARRYALLLSLLAVSGAALRPVPVKTSVAPRAVEPVSDWKEVDRLVSEQKVSEALARVDAILAAARGRGDEENWTRALVRHAQMETALHGYETAVRFLKEERRPRGLLSRVTLDLYYAEALVAYAEAYSWEIGQRERVEPPGPDLKAWTREQISEEARRAYLDAWERREEIGQTPVAKLSEYLEKNDYPPGVRGTLRDALTYLFVELLADTGGWTPGESASAARLPLARLLAAEGPAARDLLTDPRVHPLEKAVAILADLEAWHAAAGRREAALEARLERLRRLHASFTLEADRAAIRKSLEERLARSRDIPWWSMGMATLAGFREARDSPENLIEALAAAREGEKAYPDSAGGKTCRSIAQRIEAPDYQLAGMTQDGPARRSILVTHKNAPDLHFRAYSVDLLRRIESVTDYNLLPSGREAKDLLSASAPAAQWSVTLPPTADYKPHRTFVTPPLSEPGLYVVVASARKDFGERRNRIVSTNLIVGGLVLVTRPQTAAIEARALSGDSGEPVASAQVTLYRFDWNRRHAPVETKTTGPDGFARFDYAPGREGTPYFLLARKGKDSALDASYLSLARPSEPSEATQALLYTDRSIYRPGQTIAWKALVFSGRRDLGRFRTLAGSPVSISLVDANNQTVASKTATTNAFGTVAGEFPIPPGRALGAWRIDSSAGGSASVSVEEYKRPTFEASWKDLEGTARLNRPVTLVGSARYYFGLPVARGTVVWRVTREPEIPWWWRWYPPRRQAEVVGQGTSALAADGSFQITFTPGADERLGQGKEITYRYAATADVTDEGGETRSDTRSFRVGFVGVEAAVRGETAFFREGVLAAVTVLRTDLNGAPRPGTGSWRVVELSQPEKTRLPSELPAPLNPAAERFATPGDRQRPRWDGQPPLDAILHDWP